MAVVVLSGAIGAGKSSLTKYLADYLGAEPVYEQIDNPVLPLFYEDPYKYAYRLQLFFLNARFHNIKKALKGGNYVLDRSIYEDPLLFKINADMGRASQVEIASYDATLDKMMNELQALPKSAPDLMVHLKISYSTMIKWIKKRGREYEQIENDSSLVDYYHRMLNYYDEWYENYNYSPKMIINGDDYDFVSNIEDRQEILSQIAEKLSDDGSSFKVQEESKITL